MGDSNVGKSSLLLRFTADTFEDSVAPTIGEIFPVVPLCTPSGFTLVLTMLYHEEKLSGFNIVQVSTFG